MIKCLSKECIVFSLWNIEFEKNVIQWGYKDVSGKNDSVIILSFPIKL